MNTAPRPGGWTALSQHDPTRPGAGAGRKGLMERGALVLELAVPLRKAQVLLDYHAEADGWERAFSILHDPESGLTIRHRQGKAVALHRLCGPLPAEPGIAQVILSFDAPARHWKLSYCRPGSGTFLAATGEAPLPLPLDDLDRMCALSPLVRRHEAVLWFGATSQATPPCASGWVHPQSRIATPSGFRQAGSLGPGDTVLLHDGSARGLRSVRHLDLPGRGSHTPVRLRAPYFVAGHDLLVSADLPVLLTGGDIEDVYGEPALLVAAQHLTDSFAAIFDTGHMVVRTVSLDVGAPAVVQGDGMAFLSASHTAGQNGPPPLRQLRGFEAMALLAALNRGNTGWRAA
ncbi:hypothetical protein GCM10007291_20360 [Gemmobacter nanjingensis]|uniref:Hedgehog/Intein (Hint) domain-containing protein n=1 Tax=Gemmobacter nanjingensis TaxID=488454 RepID=A0ABQ3FFC7_9RHOB|nr:Hint domain-containing protein [Gemmobacter nanjingensis]GHC21245.1 hypothetical protein GCM10007291_20360 [Gemmobacter nanjingensis]